MLNIAGLTYALISLALVSAMVFLNHKIRFVTNTYWFWLSLAIIVFVWVFSVRFVPDWIKHWQEHDFVYANVLNPDLKIQRDVNKTISRAFMLDACPFFFCCMLISLIADPSRRMARIFAPIALIGGIISLGTIITSDNEWGENAKFTAEYIFFGNDYFSGGRERCFFIMHWCQVMFAVGILLNTPKSGWRVWLTSLGSFGLYLAYVGIVMAISGCCWYCTGIALNDYTPSSVDLPGGGEYRIVIDITKLPRSLWWLCPLILLPILAAAGVAVGGVAHDYIFTSKWIWKYGNAKSDKWQHWYNFNKFDKPNKAWW